MNSRVPLFVLTGALALTLHAQELAPELLPLATKHKADSAALEAQKTAEIDRVTGTYGTALDTAEKMETAAGHLPAIAAITKERGDLKKGGMETGISKELPKSVQTPRKAYLDGIARVVADFGQRKERINADYLRTLAALQTRIGSNPALARQVNEEKERVLADAATTGNAAVLGKWNVTCGDWRGWRTLNTNGTVTCSDGPPAKWKISASILRVSYTDGVVEEYSLPVHDGKLTGKKKGDVVVNAEKAKD